MKVHLHLTDAGKPVFHAERLTVREVHPPHHGIRGWLERTARRLKEGWTHAEHGAVGKAREFWERLHRRMPFDESMLIHLRSASSIEVLHPVAMPSEEAQVLWNGYLTRCWRRHLPWLFVNILIAPISILLAPIPGPNLIGYWFVYRAVRDLLVLLGIRHAQNAQVVTTYHPTDSFEAYAGAQPSEGTWPPGSHTGGVTFAGLGPEAAL